jgi:hypothetical protein
VNGDSHQSSRIPTILAASRLVQRFRFHLIFGVRFGAIATVTIWLLIGLLEWTSSTWTHSTSSLLKTSLFSLVAFLGTVHVIPHFIRLTLCGSLVIYGVLMLAQWFVVGFGISFLFRSRQWFFNSTILFWLLFPLTFVPLILTSSGIKYWCGFGLGQPREWLYYCEDVGATFFSVTAFLENLTVGLVGVILMRQLAKFMFGKRESGK